MKSRKKLIASIIALSACCCLSLPAPRVLGYSYVVQGVYQFTVPVGSREWTVALKAGSAYEIYLGLFTPGNAHFMLTVVDPWGQHYTFVDLEFWHPASSNDLYKSKFMPPLAGNYVFTLATSGGTGQALDAYFAILEDGAIANGNTNAGSPLRDAHACNASHTVWAYVIPLEGSATYFIDVARGDPSGVEVPIMVSAKVEAMMGLEIPVLINESLPWEAPGCNETQVMQWASEWFGVPATTSYYLVVEVSGLASPDPVVVAITVSKEQSHGNATAPGDDMPGDTGSSGLTVSLDGVMWVAGPCAFALLVVGMAVIGTKRKKGVRGEAGVLKREVPAEGW